MIEFELENWRRRPDLNRGWRFCRFSGAVNHVVSCWSLVCPAPRFCFVVGLYWTTFGLWLSGDCCTPPTRPAAVEVPCDSALKSRRRAIGLLPSLGLLENGARRRAARSGRVCRRDRLGHGDLHRRQRRAAAAAAVPGRRALRVAVPREHDRPGHDELDVGARAAGLPAADHELRRVRLVPHRPIPPDGPWRAAIRPRRGGDAGARAAARSTAPRPVVRRRHERRHLDVPVAPSRRRARDHRQRHHARRAPVHDHAASCRQRFSFRSRAWG